METLQTQTTEHEELKDITSQVSKLLSSKGWKDGAVLLYCPHTTGAVTIKIVRT